MMKSVRMLSVSTLVALAVGISASDAVTFNLSGPMDTLQAESNGGFGATAPGGGIGTGTITGNYDNVSKLLNYSISWQDLNPGSISNMHFHLGAAGASGVVDLPIPSPWTSPKVGTNIGLTAGQETNLLAGNWYVNIHTSTFPLGEIRGQVLVTPVPEPATASIAYAALLWLCGIARRWR